MCKYNLLLIFAQSDLVLRLGINVKMIDIVYIQIEKKLHLNLIGYMRTCLLKLAYNLIRSNINHSYSNVTKNIQMLFATVWTYIRPLAYYNQSVIN